MADQEKEYTLMDAIEEAMVRIEQGIVAPMTDEEIEADIQEYRREKAEKNRKKDVDEDASRNS